MHSKVLVFGAFDPLHQGHIDLFKQASELGDELAVVVTRDSGIRQVKNREPQLNEIMRRQEVEQNEYVDEALLGDEWPNEDSYRLLEELDFDILALGFDQLPDDKKVREELNKRGKKRAQVVRLESFEPERYSSTRLRGFII